MKSKWLLMRKNNPLLWIPLSLVSYSACSVPESRPDEGDVQSVELAVGGANNCMDDVFPGNLTCTANDVRIARANNISVPSCVAGADITFTADFQVEAGSTRYDIGLYFATDGDPDANGALFGQCAVNVITPQNAPATFVNVDVAPDTCGDIRSGKAQFVTLAITTKCIDDDGDGKLNLPYCTSWRQPGSNAVCNQPEQAFPGSPSKCKCDKSFNLDVTVEQPSITVVKTASPAVVNEPGGSVIYTVSVTNNGQMTALTLTQLDDDPDDDPNTNNTITFPLSNCAKQQLNPGETTTCTFSAMVSGNAGESRTDNACVSGIDANGNPVARTCDTATVTIRDVPPIATLTKTAEKVVSAVVQYQVKVDNNGDEPLELNNLVDNQFGDITGVQGDVVGTTCTLNNTVIAAKSSFTCAFDAVVRTLPHTNEVTGTLSDNEGNSVLRSDDATVVSVTMSAQ